MRDEVKGKLIYVTCINFGVMHPQLASRIGYLSVVLL